ncbi:type II secretion system protein [Pseudomonas sp. A46]|nr:prepilin-type N-terminal cleavage/methylation domain-containing protein [Pseudomonas sp. A46]OWJ97278.1 type II secretion system protein [Pseudomonas sp. A46]
MTRQRPAQAGFTLLEMLAAIMLVAFVGSLMVQMLIYLEKASQGIQRHTAAKQVRSLSLEWFTGAVEGLLAPEPSNDESRFRGDEFSFEGVSAGSLARRPGIPVAVAFRLENDPEQGYSALIYVRRLEDSRWALLQLPGVARFRYLDVRGRWHADWPPTPRLADSLPEAVSLQADSAEVFVLAAVMGPRTRPVDDEL